MRAFIWKVGDASLTDLGVGTDCAYGINSSNQVVGSTRSAGGFLWQAGSLTTPLYGTASFDARAINDAGDIAATRTFAGTQIAAMIHAGMVTLIIGLSGSTDSFAVDINASGQVACLARLVVGNQFSNERTFIWASGAQTDIGLPPGSLAGQPFVGCRARAINSSGAVCGVAYNAAFQGAAFVYSGGTFTILNSLLSDFPASQITDAWDINDSGVVTAVGSVSGVAVGFLISGGSVTVLGTDFATEPRLNNSGQVISSGTPAPGGRRAGNGFIWTSGVKTALPGFPDTPPFLPSPADQTIPCGINDAGYVVGTAPEGLSQG